MAAINEVTDLTLEGDVAVITLDSPPVNALSFNVRDGLFEGFKAAIADPSAAAIVLICAGRTFIAGADISEFGGASKGASLSDVQAHDGELAPSRWWPPSTAPPSVAGSRSRCAPTTASPCPSARCGLPEVNLGLLPGAGGTQRLPRIAGPRRALEMMTSGTHVAAHECLGDGSGRRAGRRGRRCAPTPSPTPAASPPTGAPLAKISDRAVEPMSADEFAAFRAANARKFRGFKAPEAIIQTVEAAVSLPFDEGMKVERELFTGLVTSAESAAQRYVFFAEREVWKIPDVPADHADHPGGVGGHHRRRHHGRRHRHELRQRRHPRHDRRDPAGGARPRALGVVRANYERSARNGRFPIEDVDRRMGLITGSLSLDDLATVDLVIEAVFERMDIKKDVFTKLDAICKPGAVLATNTSALNIDEIAPVTERPESVIGLHFFSPANVMRLVEVVRADHTSIEVINTSMQIAKKIGKIAALVGVCPGFVGNRMLAQRGREAQALARRGGHAVGRGPRAVRLRLRHGPVPDDATWPGSTSAG